MRDSKARDLGLLVLRLAGLYLAFGHGLGKLQAMLLGDADRIVGMVDALGFPMPLLFAWALTVAEFGGGLAIAFGLYTRGAATLAGIAMFTASFVRHRALTRLATWLGVGSATPEELRSFGNPEMSMLYLVICLTLLLLGPGELSLDAKIAQWRRPTFR